MAVQPAVDLEPAAQATTGFSFDTFELQHALLRSRQQAGACGGLRRATSAPHSMDMLGMEPSASSAGAGAAAAAGRYLPPSGGPMRRVASSLGMRRSASFFWTPSAHHDFERAIHALASRGAEITATAIMDLMGARHAADLKLADVEKHLRKKVLVQRRVLQQLQDRPNDAAAAASSGVSLRVALPAAVAPQQAPAMAAVAEEPHQPPSPVAPPAAAAQAAAAAAAAALSDNLVQQFQAQQMQHMQFSAARESIIAAAEAQIVQQTPNQASVALA